VEDAEPPAVWGDGAMSGAATTPGAHAPYDPFAQAWTAEHDWGSPRPIWPTRRRAGGGSGLCRGPAGGAGAEAFRRRPPWGWAKSWSRFDRQRRPAGGQSGRGR